MKDRPRQLALRPLTAERERRRAELELVIPDAIAMYTRGGLALVSALGEIKREKLYESTHPDFYAYCEETWGIRRDTVTRIIHHSEVIRALRIEPEQITQGAATALKKLPLPVQAEVLPKIKKLAGSRKRQAGKAGKKPAPIDVATVQTAANLEQLIDRRLPRLAAAPRHDEPEPIAEPEPEPNVTMSQVPLEVRKALARRHEFDALVRSVQAVMRRVDQLGAQKLGSYLVIGAIRTDLSNAIAAIKYAIPGQVCDSCGGRPETCQRCKSVGFLSEGYIAHLPKRDLM